MSEIPSEDEKFIVDLQEWMKKEFGWGQDKSSPWNDDWTMIVKLHAMVETCLNSSITRELERPALSDIVARLETSNPKTGKAAFAKALGIINKESAAFLQKLSELRNTCVHDIRNFKFNLDAYLREIDEEKSKDLLKSIKKVMRPDAIETTPQHGLVIGTMGIMMQLMVHELACKRRGLEEELLKVKAQKLDELNRSNPKE